MVGILRPIVVALVARHAVGRRSGEAVGVALAAVQRRVRPGQRPELFVVGELCATPSVGRVTQLAIGRESELFVVRIGRLLERLLVAVVTVGGRARELLGVTALAPERGMPALENEELVMVENGLRVPIVDRVTEFAVAREAERGVIGVGDLLVVGAVAGVTVRGCVRELERGCGLMAGIAVDVRVAAQQRKAGREVEDEHLAVILPALDRMAALAIDADLAPVRVGMAIDTRGGHVLEHQTLVTRLAVGRAMAGFEREAGFAVVVFDRVFEGGPGARRVAGGARDVEALTVRILGALLSDRRPVSSAHEDAEREGERQHRGGQPQPHERGVNHGHGIRLPARVPWQPRQSRGRGL